MLKKSLSMLSFIMAVSLASFLITGCAQKPDPEQLVFMLKDEAQGFIYEYCKRGLEPCDVRTIDLDRAQWEVMQKIIDEYGEQVKAFRIYVGVDPNGNPDEFTTFIRPLDAAGNEIGDNYYQVTGPLFSTCPVVCDRLVPSLQICQ